MRVDPCVVKDVIHASRVEALRDVVEELEGEITRLDQGDADYRYYDRYAADTLRKMITKVKTLMGRVAR